jgi:hypothetical protein
MSENKGLTHCEECHRFHTEEDICKPLLIAKVAKLEPLADELERVMKLVRAGKVCIRGCAQRPYNTVDEQAWFDEMAKLAEDE